MHIGLYFGSFNPIHIGHLIIANFIATEQLVDEVWFVVSPQNPLKPAHSLLKDYDRLHLVQLAVQDQPLLKVSDIEFKLPKPSYTIDTLTYLTEKYPLHRFSIIAGSDSFQNLPHWKNYETLINNYSFIVYPRKTLDVNFTYPSNVTVANAPLLDISATFIRQRIKNGKSVRFLLPISVEAEIIQNGYYREKPIL